MVSSIKVIDEIYSKYKKTVNMSFSELKKWKKNPKSKLASLTRRPINQNLKLLNTPKSKWGAKEVRVALKTIGFIKRMKKIKRGGLVVGNLSKRDIALKNWGYNPFKKK